MKIYEHAIKDQLSYDSLYFPASMNSSLKKSNRIVYLRFILIAFIFTILFVQSNAQTWQNAGNQDFTPGAAGSASIAVDNTGVPYVAWQEGLMGKISVMKLVNGVWTSVGPAGFSATGGALTPATFVKIVLNGTTPYIAFWDRSQSICVMKFDGTNWVLVGNRFSNVPVFNTAGFTFYTNYTSPDLSHTLDGDGNLTSRGLLSPFDFTVDNAGTPYVSFPDNQFQGGDLTLPTVMKFDGTNWVYVGKGIAMGTGNTLMSTSFVKMALDNTGIPYIACSIVNGGGFALNATEIFKYVSGTTWQQVGSIISGKLVNDMTIDANNNIYLATKNVNDSKATVMTYNGTSWVGVGSTGFSAGKVSRMYIKTGNTGVPIVSYSDMSNGGKATVMRYLNNSWQLIGNAGFTSSSVNNTFSTYTGAPIAVFGYGTTYIAWQNTSTDQANAMVYTPVLSINTPTSNLISSTSALFGGTVLDEGTSAITGRGIIYSSTAVNPDPLIGGTGVTRVQESPVGKIGAFNLNATGLTANTIYTYKAYVTNSTATSYTDAASFSTNQAPIISSNGAGTTASINFAENSISAVTTVTATDADASQTKTYSITGGTDASIFTINSSSGVLSFNAAPDYENPSDANKDNVYEVIVTVTDNGQFIKSGSQTISITVTDVAEAPIVSSKVTAFDVSTASIGAATVLNAGGGTISSKGVIYSLTKSDINQSSPSGTTVNNATGGDGAFSVNLTGLTTLNTYYFKAFATNTTGTTYSLIDSFFTQNPNSVPNISYTSPQLYAINTAITPLSVASTGGVVPALKYRDVSFFAGNTSNSSGDVIGTGTAAKFYQPVGLVNDASGNTYVADTWNHKIKMITAAGVVTTIAGTGSAGSADNPGSTATFNYPTDVEYDGTNSRNCLYIADKLNGKIRKVLLVSPFTVSTIATGLGNPEGISMDPLGNYLYVADRLNHKILRITLSTNALTTIAGAGSSGSSDNLTGTSATFNNPVDLVVDNTNTFLYVADYSNNKIRKIALTSPYAVTTFAGSGSAGKVDAVGTAATFEKIRGLVFDGVGNLYGCDEGNNAIRKITPQGEVSTFIGSLYGGNLETPGTGGRITSSKSQVTYYQNTYNGNDALLYNPQGLSIDKTNGVMYISEYLGNTIRKLNIGGYSVSPALPAGMSINETTGQISGTPNQYALTTYYSNDFNKGDPGIGVISGTAVINGGILKLTSDVQNQLGGFTVPASGVNADAYKIDFDVMPTKTYYDGYGFSYSFGDDASATTGSQYASIGTGTKLSVSFDVTGNNDVGQTAIYWNPDNSTNTTYIYRVPYTTDWNGKKAHISIYIDSKGRLTLTSNGVIIFDKVQLPASYVNANKATWKHVFKAETCRGCANDFSYRAELYALDNIYLQQSRSEGVFNVTANNYYGSKTTQVKIKIIDVPPVTINSINAITAVASTANITIENNGFDIVNARGICWGTAANPNTSNSTLSAGSGTGNFSVNLTGLQPNTIYYVRAYATNLAGTGYSDQVIFRTLATPPTSKYTSPQTYFVNSAIPSLTPTNTGGIVPAAYYSGTNTFAGTGSSGNADGIGTSASFKGPAGIAVDFFGNVFVADITDNKIRKITSDGTVTTFAGSGTASSVDGIGIAATFNGPSGLAFGSNGLLYVTEKIGNKIRSIDPNGNVVTIAGSGSAGSNNAIGVAATFNAPSAIAVDSIGNLFITDQGNNKIRKITSDGTVTTFAGSGNAATMDGVGVAASIDDPSGLVFDKNGNLFVVSTNADKIRKITPDGTVSTFAGYGGPLSADGVGLSAYFFIPSGITIDQSGNLYVTEKGNGSYNGSNKIRKISPAAEVSSIAGNAYVAGSSNNNIGASATFNTPLGIGIGYNGLLYVADYGNHLIRTVSLNGYKVSPTLPAGLTMNLTTGSITGTPTVNSPATDYTITSNNSGGAYSTKINITVNSPAVWQGTSSTNWNTPGNWIGNTVPAVGADISISSSATNDLVLDQNREIGTLDFGTATKSVLLGNYNLTVNAAILNADANSYIKTNGTGKLVKIINPNESFNFPVGNTALNAVNISNKNTKNDQFTVNEVDNVYVNGTSGSTVSFPRINRTWNIGKVDGKLGVESDDASMVGVDLQMNWNSGAESVGGISNYKLIHHNGTSWEFATSGVSSSLGSTAISHNGYVGSYSPFSISGPAIIPALTSTAVSSIRSTTASSGGTISDNGGAAITANGVCYSTTSSPTISDSKTTDAIGNPETTPFVSSLTGLTPNTTYFVRAYATNSAGTAYGNEISFTTLDIAPTGLSYTTPNVFTKGTVITSLTPTVSGGAVVSYAITPSLPVGLTFNTTSGVISGTPTALASSATYTVTATNTGGSTTATLSITVNDVAPTGLSYTTPNVFTKGTVITSLTPTVSGGAVVSYAITPSLPVGLTFNTTSGVISGTPTALASSATYTVTATNTGGSTTATLSITVNDVAPTGLSYTTPNVFTKGTVITSLTPTVSGGAVVSYAITPSLPVGLTFNTTSGVISGTPTALASSATYTVTATNTGGSTTATLSITVNDNVSTWTGAIDSDWGNAGNWDNNFVPGSTDDILIPNGTPNALNVTNTVSVRNITINTGATLTLTGTLNIGGVITNNGSFTAIGGRVNMSGSSSQIIPAYCFTTNTINDLTINNTSGVILGGALNINNILNLNSGTFATNSYLTIKTNATIIGDYSNITGNVTLEQDIIGQRGYRIFANPFSTPQTNLSLSGLNATTTTTNDVKTWSNAQDSWLSAGAGYSNLNIGANVPYACFIRGAASDNVTGLNYTSGPSTFTYRVNGTLNGNSTTITPSDVNNFMVVGNPYAAPINSAAITGQVAGTNYYTYQISITGTPQVKSGSWVPSSSTSDYTNTIPKLGVVAYQPVSTSSFNITNMNINNNGTKQTGIFSTVNTMQQLELSVEQFGNYQDKLFIRYDSYASPNGSDRSDLKKFYNDITNLYTITPDKTRLAIDTRNVLSTIPLGINAPIGNYNFNLVSNTMPNGTVIYLKDNFLHSFTEIKKGDIINFNISSDTSSKGDARFELSIFSNNTYTSGITSDIQSAKFNVDILGNITSSNTIPVRINGNKGPVSIRATDVYGRTWATIQSSAGVHTLNLGNFTSGILFIQFNDGESVITKKIIKQ